MLGVSRAGYHAWKKREPSLRDSQDASLKERISETFAASYGIYGAPRIQAELAEAHGIHVGPQARRPADARAGRRRASPEAASAGL